MIGCMHYSLCLTHIKDLENPEGELLWKLCFVFKTLMIMRKTRDRRTRKVTETQTYSTMRRRMMTVLKIGNDFPPLSNSPQKMQQLRSKELHQVLIVIVINQIDKPLTVVICFMIQFTAVVMICSYMQQNCFCPIFPLCHLSVFIWPASDIPEVTTVVLYLNCFGL